MNMNKRFLHHIWTRIRPIKTWYVLAALILSASVSVVSLRNNYIGMTERRGAVYKADQNSGDVEGALQALRAYTAAHMNTDLEADNGVYPPIQLKYTYARLVQAEHDRVDAINSQVYTEAQHYCEALYPGSFSGGPRVPCIEAYIKQHGASTKTIPDSLYKFDFVSPRWSPDLAGWSLLLSVVLFFLTILRFIVGRWLRHITR